MFRIGIMLLFVCLTITLLNAQDFYDINTINTVEISFEQDDWEHILHIFQLLGNDERLTGTATINGVVFDSVGVRYKGNSSYSPHHAKNPFNIKLDYIIDNQLLGNYGTLKLSNGFKDPTFIREALSYEIARNYMPASKSNFVNLYINGVLIGLYASNQDVDKHFMSSHFNCNNQTRIKGELNYAGNNVVVWDYIDADSSSYHNFYELESDYGWEDLINFLDTYNNNSSNMNTVLNVDSHLWFLAFQNLLVNLDSPINFGHNYYLFQDNSNRFNPVLWDLNESFGVFTHLLTGEQLDTTQLQNLDPLLFLTHPNYPIIGRVLSIAENQRKYVAHMRTIIDECFVNGWYETRANELQDIIENDLINDSNRFYSMNDFETNVTDLIYVQTGPGGYQPLIGITYLMEARITYILNTAIFQGVIPSISEIAHAPETCEPGDTIFLTARVEDAVTATLGYRQNENCPFTQIEMADDGAHGDQAAGDGIYGASFELTYGNLQYYIYAENQDQGIFSPERAEYEYHQLEVTAPTGNIVINEINYHSSDDFNTEDWIELYNPESETIDISGWQFMDENDDHVFVIPDNTELISNGFLVLVQNTELFTSLFPGVDNFLGDIGFGFSGGGELLRLFDANSDLIDYVEYSDTSPWPTEPDGGGASLELINPLSDNALPESWVASNDYGSPGMANELSIDEELVSVRPIQLSVYPNPFNPRTTISFSVINQPDYIDVSIYNIRGQHVVCLLKDQLAPGTHKIQWSGKNDINDKVASGIYFACVQSANHGKAVKKIMLLK